MQIFLLPIQSHFSCSSLGPSTLNLGLRLAAVCLNRAAVLIFLRLRWYYRLRNSLKFSLFIKRSAVCLSSASRVRLAVIAASACGVNFPGNEFSGSAANGQLSNYYFLLFFYLLLLFFFLLGVRDVRYFSVPQ